MGYVKTPDIIICSQDIKITKLIEKFHTNNEPCRLDNKQIYRLENGPQKRSSFSFNQGLQRR